jgi:predicted MFS family arabinose efflux permease
VIGTYLVLPLFLFIPSGWFIGSFRLTFLIAAAVLLLAFLATSRLRGWDRSVRREKLYFRKRYIKYYILEIFFGARKQVFITFAPYVLILNYGARTELIASLQGIWALANIIIAPLVGKLLDRFGYKRLILLDTFLLVVLCMTYGFSHRIFPGPTAFIIVCCVFVLDAVLFTVGIARAMYVKSIARSRDEVTSTLSTGLSINHLVSIVIAMLGGALWEALGIEILFSLAALFGLGSFGYALTLPRPADIQKAGRT